MKKLIKIFSIFFITSLILSSPCFGMKKEKQQEPSSGENYFYKIGKAILNNANSA